MDTDEQKMDFLVAKFETLLESYEKNRQPGKNLSPEAIRESSKHSLRNEFLNRLGQTTLLKGFCESKTSYLVKLVRQEDARLKNVEFEVFIEKSLKEIAAELDVYQQGDALIEAYLKAEVSGDSAKKAAAREKMVAQYTRVKRNGKMIINPKISSYSFFWRQQQRGGPEYITEMKSCLVQVRAALSQEEEAVEPAP